MPDQFARALLLFSNSLVLIPLLLIGLICIDRRIFYHAGCLAFLSILVNVALKLTFKMPLSPALGKVGYAFPSGHMQLVTVVYGWLAIEFNKTWLRAVLVVFLVGFALSLIHFGYHNLVDVLAAVLCAFLLLLIYALLERNEPQELPWLCLVFSGILLLYIAWQGSIENYVWNAFYSLCGLIITGQLQRLISRRFAKH